MGVAGQRAWSTSRAASNTCSRRCRPATCAGAAISSSCRGIRSSKRSGSSCHGGGGRGRLSQGTWALRCRGVPPAAARSMRHRHAVCRRAARKRRGRSVLRRPWRRARWGARRCRATSEADAALAGHACCTLPQRSRDRRRTRGRPFLHRAGAGAAARRQGRERLGLCMRGVRPSTATCVGRSWRGGSSSSSQGRCRHARVHARAEGPHRAAPKAWLLAPGQRASAVWRCRAAGRCAGGARMGSIGERWAKRMVLARGAVIGEERRGRGTDLRRPASARMQQCLRASNELELATC